MSRRIFLALLVMMSAPVTFMCWLATCCSPSSADSRLGSPIRMRDVQIRRGRVWRKAEFLDIKKGDVFRLAESEDGRFIRWEHPDVAEADSVFDPSCHHRVRCRPATSAELA